MQLNTSDGMLLNCESYTLCYTVYLFYSVVHH